ncbi:hypothetical protein B0H17DRAFT_1124904 [Mycena rosella]|uniref:Uncharacterized protein n=1 Tax=Mycena rosella TaxID=1033263 RepID=A0AAD7GYY6_MYCRO|nr:hypothetical protein B0H17DRAFT_1124904 [Mycena rosella]
MRFGLADLRSLVHRNEIVCIGKRHPWFVEDGARELGVIRLECVDDAADQEGFRVEGATLPNGVTRLGEEHGRGRETSCVGGLACGAKELVAVLQRGPGAVVRRVELEGRRDVRVVVLRLDEASHTWECHTQLIANLDAERDPVAALETEMLLVGPDARSGAVAGEAAAAGQRDAAPPGAAAACAGSRTRSQEAGWGIAQPSGVGQQWARAVAGAVPHTASAGGRA